MDANKPLAFKGSAGGFFVASIVSGIMWYIPIIGWPIAFNFMNSWIVDNLEVNGRKLKYSAGYGETLGFLFVGILLTIITFGIYGFWFAPKSYRFAVDHSSYVGETAAAITPEAPVAPETPAAPVA